MRGVIGSIPIVRTYGLVVKMAKTLDCNSRTVGSSPTQTSIPPSSLMDRQHTSNVLRCRFESCLGDFNMNNQLPCGR